MHQRLADAHEINVAPHNFNGHLGSLMSAHFCAAIPTFRVMEIDIEDVSWKDAVVTVPPKIEAGDLLIPRGAGWGADVNEEVLREHPPKKKTGSGSAVSPDFRDSLLLADRHSEVERD